MVPKSPAQEFEWKSRMANREESPEGTAEETAEDRAIVNPGRQSFSSRTFEGDLISYTQKKWNANCQRRLKFSCLDSSDFELLKAVFRSELRLLSHYKPFSISKSTRLFLPSDLAPNIHNSVISLPSLTELSRPAINQPAAL